MTRSTPALTNYLITNNISKLLVTSQQALSGPSSILSECVRFNVPHDRREVVSRASFTGYIAQPIVQKHSRTKASSAITMTYPCHVAAKDGSWKLAMNKTERGTRKIRINCGRRSTAPHGRHGPSPVATRRIFCRVYFLEWCQSQLRGFIS